MLKLILTVAAYFISFKALASAESGHGEGHGEIPKVVYYQAINVGIIFIAGYCFGKQKIADFFHQKRQLFVDAQQKANKALDLAKHEHHDVKTRLDKLKHNRVDTISRANADANDLRKQIIADAELMAKKLKLEAEQASQIEIHRVKNELRDQLVREAFELSRKDINTKATAADQKRLQQDFINKVQVVQ
jgi:F-type H+-transporting ATPase subunit b